MSSGVVVVAAALDFVTRFPASIVVDLVGEDDPLLSNSSSFAELPLPFCCVIFY